MKEIKKAIVKAFKAQYGFAPAMKDIIPLETSGSGDLIDWIAFHVNGHGYDFATWIGKTGYIKENEAYNM